MIISFSGTSGSGKSSIISKLVKSNLFNGKRVVVKEEDSFLVIKLLKTLLGEGIFLQYKEEKYFKKRYSSIYHKLFSSLSYLCYPIVVYIEFLIDHIYYQVLFKDTVLIVDKYIYDHVVIFKNALKIDNKFVRWLFGHLPKPYLSFLISIDYLNALKRNKNNVPGKITAEKIFHKKILADYKKVSEKHNLLVVDNNDDFKDTVKTIEMHILNKARLMNVRRIAICGMDGAGKTTVVNMLAKYASSLNIDCRIVHFVHNNLVYRILLALGYYDMNKPKNMLYKRSRAHSAKERENQTPFFMAFLRFFDSYIQYLFYVLMNRNKLIIFDRFFYDYAVSFEYLNIPSRTYFNKFIPKIDNKFLFNASPEVLYKRKPERVKAFFLECYELYQKMAKNMGIKEINTDNKKPQRVMDEILKSLADGGKKVD